MPDFALNGTGANDSEKNVKLINERFNLLVLISDRSSSLYSSKFSLSINPNLNTNMDEQGNPIVHPEETPEDPTNEVSGSEVSPEGPPSSEPKVPEDTQVVVGSQPLIGKGAKIQFPKALTTTGGGQNFKSYGVWQGGSTSDTTPQSSRESGGLHGVHPTQRR